jgi:hypothetical protein
MSAHPYKSPAAFIGNAAARGKDYEKHILASVSELKTMGYEVVDQARLSDKKGNVHIPDFIIRNRGSGKFVVVDAKNYHGTLPSKEVEKLVVDMVLAQETYGGRCVKGIIFCRSDTDVPHTASELMERFNIVRLHESRETLKAYIRELL